MHPDDLHEFRVGRIKHERVRVPRGQKLLSWAIRVLRAHADRKAILEVEFAGEEGTGLGPTLEFFALVAAELQRKDLGMWLCDDDNLEAAQEEDRKKEKEEEEEGELSVVEQVVGDVGEKKKPPGYYVSRPYGRRNHLIIIFFFGVRVLFGSYAPVFVLQVCSRPRCPRTASYAARCAGCSGSWESSWRRRCR